MPAAEKASNFGVFMILLKSYLGTGLLAIPYAVECGGMWSAVIGITALAMASNYTMKMLIRLKRHVEAEQEQMSKEPLLGGDSEGAEEDSDRVPLSFMDLGEYALGRYGRLAAKATMLTTNLGISVGYLMFVSNTMADAIQGNHTDEPLVRELVGSIKFNLMSIIVLPILMLLCQIRDIQKLSFSSLLGNFSLCE
jgi:proton-coupled amino acid transporter